MITLRPSAAERWMNCPASAFHNEDKPTKYSKAGTDLHSQAHDILIGKANIDENTDENVKFYCDYVLRSSMASYMPPDYERTIARELGDIEIKGTPDAVLYFYDAVEIVDFKSGYKDVEPDSPQLILYAYLAVLGHNKVILTVIQNKQIKTRVIHNFKESEELKNVLSKIPNILKPNPVYQEGSWCQFCSFKTKCKKYLNSINPLLNLLPEPETLSDTVLASYYDMRSFMTSYFDSVKAEMIKRIGENKIKTHYIKSRKKQKVTKIDEMVGWLYECGLKQCDIFEMSFKSLPDIINIVEEKIPHKIEEFVKEFVTFTEAHSIAQIEENEIYLLPALTNGDET